MMCRRSGFARATPVIAQLLLSVAHEVNVSSPGVTPPSSWATSLRASVSAAPTRRAWS